MVEPLMMTKVKNAFNKESEHKNLEFHIKNVSVNGIKKGCCGFIVNNDNGKIVFFNSDIIPFTGKPVEILFRSAESLDDYCGGINQYAPITDYVSKIGQALR